jgi:DegV family protein with EDD domain
VDDYISQNNNRKGCVIDSLSVGPESALIIEKLCQLIKQGHEFEEIKSQITDYQNTTHLIFCLDSLRNLANNGRVSTAVAKFAGLLGIRIVGKASLEGTLEIADKCRGSAKAHQSIINNMLKEGYNGGKLRIHHCENPDGASLLEEEIKSRFPKADVSIKETRALCSFYAESGGLLVGFEGKRK